MTTQEKLLAEAREWLTEEGFKRDELRAKDMPRYMADFALSQLRAAKESGWLKHANTCMADALIMSNRRPCSCGFAERFGDL